MLSLTNSMRPVFWQRFNFFNMIRRAARENVYLSAANAEVYQKDLVQKTMTQLYEYNHDDLDGMYTRPTLDLQFCNRYWGYLTKGMSAEELADFEKARETLTHYDKIYSLVEYASDLHEGMTCLEKRIMTQNPTIPMNIYRASSSNSADKLFAEIEDFMQAYYDLIDDCEHFPLWKRKLQEDLGGSVSFLGI